LSTRNYQSVLPQPAKRPPTKSADEVRRSSRLGKPSEGGSSRLGKPSEGGLQTIGFAGHPMIPCSQALHIDQNIE
jgi:hypothetical protein